MSLVSRTVSTSSHRCVATPHMTTIVLSNHILPICLPSFGAFLYIYIPIYHHNFGDFHSFKGGIFACGKQTQRAFNFERFILKACGVCGVACDLEGERGRKAGEGRCTGGVVRSLYVYRDEEDVGASGWRCVKTREELHTM